ncbi:unannotated protein [freshwater metagenome]|uniref:Unannotated protein n=1 Tax=freshwater metagenome TaxID=449393 RepID=A0A6J7EAK3_9ZZZZ|nr:hypothetical protein [Actinomycetota bacterium]
MTFRHVTVPVDFSLPSLSAIGVGQILAQRSGADLQLLSIAATHGAAEAEAELQRLSHEAGPGTNWRIITTDEDPEQPLVLTILESGDDTLWCLGSHGRTAFGELLFGSISADVVRETETRIVLVGPQAAPRPDADVMLVPMDDTENSGRILATAVEVADMLKMRLRLVQVGDHGLPSDSAESSYIRHEAAKLPAPHNLDYDVLHGNVESAINDYVAQTAEVGMIAMATRGVPAGARLTIGSTALHVLRHAIVPVLMLHPAASA